MSNNTWNFDYHVDGNKNMTKCTLREKVKNKPSTNVNKINLSGYMPSSVTAKLMPGSKNNKTAASKQKRSDDVS